MGCVVLAWQAVAATQACAMGLGCVQPRQSVATGAIALLAVWMSQGSALCWLALHALVLAAASAPLLDHRAGWSWLGRHRRWLPTLQRCASTVLLPAAAGWLPYHLPWLLSFWRA